MELKKILPLKNHPPLKKFETPIGKFYQSKCHEVIQHWRLIVFCTHFLKQDRLFKWLPLFDPHRALGQALRGNDVVLFFSFLG